jgi:hypothetical protein
LPEGGVRWVDGGAVQGWAWLVPGLVGAAACLMLAVQYGRRASVD